MQLLFDASIRAGNALWALPGRRQEAMQEYDDAVQIATTIASSSGDKGDIDVIDAHLKIGDVYKDSDAKQHQQALAEYQSGLKTCEAALSKRPDDFDLLRNKGKAFYRIAELLEGRQRARRRESLLSEGVRSSERPGLAQCAGGGRGAKAAGLVAQIKPGRDLHPLGTTRTGSRKPGACA